MNRQHDAPTAGESDLVKLDKEHPGFRDRAYRERRNAIAQQALQWKYGQPIPDIQYTADEHGVWGIDFKQLESSLELYYAKKGEYPEVASGPKPRTSRAADSAGGVGTGRGVSTWLDIPPLAD